MIKFKSLNQSKKFQSILRKKKINNKYFNIYFEKNFDNFKKDEKVLNISFVMKKKIGNAVKRNKMKRRLRNIMNDAAKKIDLNLKLRCQQ